MKKEKKNGRKLNADFLIRYKFFPFNWLRPRVQKNKKIKRKP